MTSFQYDAQDHREYPNLVAGVIVAAGMKNGPTPPQLADAYFLNRQP